MFVWIGKMSYDQALWYEIFQNEEYGLIKPFLSQTDVLIDGGAYKWFFALRALKNWFNGRLILIEPVKEFLSQAIELLKKEASLLALEALNCALWVDSKKFYQDLDRWGHSSFDFGSFQIKFLQKKTKQLLRPKICDLNSVFEKLNLGNQKVGIKLDIEWAEFEVLQNFTCWQNVDWLVVEYHLLNPELEQKFENLKNLFVQNFKQTKIKPSRYTDKIGLLVGINQNMVE